MAKVLGIGGVFLKIADQEAWRAWYRDVLGVGFEDWGGAVFPPQDAGFGLLAPHPADTTHFEPSKAPFMINLVVDDIEGMLERARGAGAEPVGREDSDYGRFASFLDPAGVKVELWQPAPESDA